tara:strand:- start:20349 stop:20522 length:174 start_codon:yes stop_codon:yes gene_type:complete
MPFGANLKPKATIFKGGCLLLLAEYITKNKKRFIERAIEILLKTIIIMSSTALRLTS